MKNNCAISYIYLPNFNEGMNFNVLILDLTVLKVIIARSNGRKRKRNHLTKVEEGDDGGYKMLTINR